MNDKRYFWPGRLVGGMGVIYRGKFCRVATESQIAGRYDAVPNGCVPIVYFSLWSTEKNILVVPFDDLDIICPARRIL